ncbi:MAG: YqaE/Pmp3 family membrane protein [Henriciella sp.]|uniref:YqaE/Pmp3 family membrane protein n=1 Tax=Henriciella sp. TaxID=1968823 RepID=UPI003C74F408
MTTHSEVSPSSGGLLVILLSILLPPLGVALSRGIGTQFVINIVLTLLGYVPGLVHAVWLAARPAD